MNFDLTDEHRMIRDMARKFADEVIAPRAEEMERSSEYPYDIFAQMAELGMMGLPYPEEYGGSGGDWVGAMLCIEEIARGDITVAALLEVTTGIAAQEIFAFGTEEQKKKWLVPLVEGKEIGAFGLTEPDSGSDAASLKTTAVLDGDEWVLNGTKRFITNIGLDNATILLAAAKVKGAQGDVISTFIVPKTARGFKLGTPYRKLSWHASATSEVILEDCRISRENILGDPNRGFAQHLTVLETGRIGIAAMSVGLAQACYEHAFRYAQERTQFGQPIYNFQAVQFKLADMAVAIELARNEYIKAAWLKDQGRPHTFETTVAKLYASEMVEKVASDAFQIHGGYGFMEEYAVSRFYASAKVLQIVDGTSEVQRMILGRLLGSRSDSRTWV
jgi:alkylation response protein AidB-like acyl-CoA dehydrogenase